MSKNDHRTVWSSEHGDLRKSKQTPASPKSLPPEQQTAYLHRESSGRGGKAVTAVKQECGTGGTIKDGLIEIQSEKRERIAEVLRKLGYKVKIAGG